MAKETNTSRNFDEDAALKAIVQGTAAGTGEAFFDSLVMNLVDVLGVHGAWVTEYLPDSERLRAYSFMLGGDWVKNYEYDIRETPCEPVIESQELICVPDRLIELYPNDPDLNADPDVWEIDTWDRARFSRDHEEVQAPEAPYQGFLQGYLAGIQRFVWNLGNQLTGFVAGWHR